MRKLSATEVARNFSDVLDMVESDGEVVIVERRGRAVARIERAPTVSGRSVKELLRTAPDDGWSGELRELRAALVAEDRPWSD